MNIIETNLTFKNLSYGNSPNKIIVHHAEASHCTIQDIHQWHLQNGWAGCGYNFFVDKQGNVYRGRPINAIGSHCLGQNAQSIGICAEGDYMIETMPEVQKKAIIELIIYLRSQYGNLPIYGHKEWYATSCPGDNYPLDDIKNLKMEEEDIMDEVVLYFGDADVFAAVIVSQKEKCPLMLYQDFKDKGLKANKVIQIGGPGATASGSNRFETFKAAATLV